MEDGGKADFKAVKIRMNTNQNTGEVLSRGMLYSGINIFGQLSQIYLQSKESGAGYQGFSESIGKSGAGEPGSGSVMNLSQDILSVFKRMQKKDPNTKVKALQELERYVDSMEFVPPKQLLDQSMQSEDISATSSQQNSDEMQSLLTFFLYHFCRIIMNEHDKKVREHAHLTLAAFIKKAKRCLGPHLKRIFSLWYCSFYDPMPEVAALARRNFDTAFPTEGKKAQVFKIAYKNFLHFANEQLKQSEEAVSEQVAELTKTQKEEVFDRITSSVLSALAKSFDYIGTWTQEEQLHFKKKLIDILDLNAPVPVAGDKAKAVQQQSYLFSFLQNKYRGRVRASCLAFISNLLVNIPEDVIKSHITQLAPLVHNLVGEDNFSLQTTLWREAFFTLGKNFPNSWENTNIKKNFLPKLFTCLKTSAFGSPSALYENFVKFVSIFPLYHLVDYTEDKINKASFKERCNLLRETLTNLYLGLKCDESVAYHQDLMKSYFETFSFILLKRVQPLIMSEKASKEDKDFAILQMKKCIQMPLEDYLINFQRFASKVQNERNIRYTIASSMTKMFIDLSQRQLSPILAQSLVEYVNESINLQVDRPNIVRFVHALLKGFKQSTNQENAPFFKEHILVGIVVKYLNGLITKVSEEVENLSKDNIDALTAKTVAVQRTLYKLNKFEAEASDIQEGSKVLQGLFNKVAMKEEMAKKVLSADVLAKFKSLKESLLKSVILAQNLLTYAPEFQSFINSALKSTTLTIALKTRLLSPISGNEFRKLKFTNYNAILGDESVHSMILGFVIEGIINDEIMIQHNWQIVDQGLAQDQSFLKKADSNVIAQAVLQKLTSLKQNDYLAIQSYLSGIKQLLTSKNLSEPVFNSLREFLFLTIMQIKTTHSAFSPLWQIYSATLKALLGAERHPYFAFCITKLKEQLEVVIADKRTQNFDAINRFTLIVKQFVQLIPSDRQQVIEEIILQESTFTGNLESNCLPLKMFRDLFLQGGLGGFDVTKLLSDSRYVWLASVLLNVRHLPSISTFLEIKRQLIIFVETELIPSLINQAQSGNGQLIIDIVKYMTKQAETNTDYIYSIEQFVKRMIDPGEDFPVEEKPVLKIEEFKTIYGIMSVEDRSLPAKFTNKVLLQMRILRLVAYYILDEAKVIASFQAAQMNLQSFISSGSKALSAENSIALEIYQSLGKYLGKEDLTTKLISQILQVQSSGVEANILNSLLTFASDALQSLGVSTFTAILSKAAVPFQSFLTWLFSLAAQLSPLTTMHLLSIVRKTLNSSELIPERTLIVQQVLDIAKHHAQSFSKKAERVAALLKKQASPDEVVSKKMGKGVHFAGAGKQSDSEDELEEGASTQVEDFEQEMLQEAAETLSVLAYHIGPDLNENDLYSLMVSGVEPLQKAAFILLKQLYENFIPNLRFKSDDTEMLKQIKEEAADEEALEGEKSKEEQKGGDYIHHHDHTKYKNKLAFRNISEVLVDIMENPPVVDSDGNATHTQAVISGSTQVESLIFKEAHEHGDTINPKIFGYFLSWNALLMKIENGRIKSQLQGNQDYSQVLGAINEYLEDNDGIYRMLMANLLAYLPEEKRGLQDAYDLSSFSPESMDLSQKRHVSLFTVFTLLNFMKSFPSLARKYCQECDKQLLELVMPYIKQIVSPAILDNEIKKIELAQLQLGASELTFALFKSTKEILANFKKGEIEMTLKIKLPTDYPLKLVEVDVSKQLKISEKQLRKWILSIRKIIQFQNGDIISAVLAWKANIEREIEGVEDCYICYAVVHDIDQSLPKMPCKTCKNKFHVACIRKWFRKSHKSNCPICQSYFF